MVDANWARVTQLDGMSRMLSGFLIRFLKFEKFLFFLIELGNQYGEPMSG